MSATLTVHDMIAELRRELALRQRVYPGWVKNGTLKPERAERQTAVLRAVIARLEDSMSFEEGECLRVAAPDDDGGKPDPDYGF